MFRSSGQSGVKHPELSSQASLILLYRPTEGLIRLCPVRGLNFRRVVWKSDALPLSHWASLREAPHEALYLPKTLITLVPFWMAETGHRMGNKNVRCDPTPCDIPALGEYLSESQREL
ncbi:hypothetical protein TNCV_3903881 [Trichonephila clavipes]|nr:hypothetical protein TNCV_3903881 [Trichonephila clavipes]